MKYLILFLTSIVYSLPFCEGYSINSSEVCSNQIEAKLKYEPFIPSDTLVSTQDTAKSLNGGGSIGVDMGVFETEDGSYGLVSMFLSYNIIIERNILFYSAYRNFIMPDISFYSFSMGLGGCKDSFCGGIGINLIKLDKEWTNGINAMASYTLFKHLEWSFNATMIDNDTILATDFRSGLAYKF